VKTFLVKADRVIERVGDAALLVSGILILIMGFLTTYGVGKRYIFHNPDPYTYEVSIILLVACILLCLPGIQWNRRNLRVDFILNHLPPRWQNIIGEIFTSVLALIFVSVVIWKSWGIFMFSIHSGQTSQSAWQEPLWPMKLMIPICMGWLFLTILSQLVHAAVHLARGTKREDTRIQLDYMAAKPEEAMILPFSGESKPIDDDETQPEDISLQLEDK
jgi:TRAP-type mannitol/chloroaromatic compound transport system permease small subunit